MAIIKKSTNNKCLRGQGGKRKPSYTAGGHVNVLATMESSMEFLQKLKIELPYNSSTPRLDIYLGKTIIQKDSYTPKFTAALSTIAKTWEKPKCPLTEEWIKMWYTHTVKC